MTAEFSNDPPVDDASIADETEVYRRVPPVHWKRVDGQFVVREGAFKNFPNPERCRMSVALGDTLLALEREPESILEGLASGYGVVALKAGLLRAAEGQRIERSPLPDDELHGDVYGDKTPSRRKRFAKHAVWVVLPSI